MKTFKQYIQEEYTYMYGNVKIDSMPLYDALVLAHEIEYKWHKLKDKYPHMERTFLRTLISIFERYKELLYKGITNWMIGHITISGPDNYSSYGYFVMDMFNKNLPSMYHVIRDIIRPHIRLSNKQLNKALKENDHELIDMMTDKDSIRNEELDDIIDKINRNNLTEILQSTTLYTNTDKEIKDTTQQMLNILNLLNNSNKNINDIMRSITLSLNIQHNSGPLLVDYLLDGLEYKQLDQLSNLPTHKWDKELEQEFGPEVLQGYRSFGK